MITKEEFEKMAKKIMDKYVRPFLRSKGVEFPVQDQEILSDHIQAFLFVEFQKAGYWDQLSRP